MADVPVKLVVLQLDHEPQQHLFEQSMIKFGRGRTGKAKSGVDLQLADPTLARVHGVIQVKKETDVSLMPMGTAATYINGLKVKSRGKLQNGTTMELGTTQITIYIGEAAAHDYLSDLAGGDTLAGSPAEDNLLAEGADISEAEMDISTGEFEVVSPGHSVEAEATGSGATDWSETYVDESEPQSPPVESGVSSVPTGSGHISASGTFSSSNEGFSLYPMHAEPEGTYGPLGPVPPALPDRMTGPNLAMLLEVHERLGKESWFVQEILW